MSSEPRAARGVIWTIGTYGLNKGMAFASTVVLARILAPSDFGIFALASTVLVFLGFIQDFGVGNSLILHPEFDKREQGTVLTLMLAFSCAVALLGVAITPLAARFFHHDALRNVLYVLAASISISGLRSFNETNLQRTYRFKQLFISDGTGSVLYMVTAISLAVAGAGVWSLVGAQVVSLVSGTLFTGYMARDKLVRPAWSPEAARISLRTGGSFVLQSMLYFFQQNTDYIAVGHSLGTAPTGFYTASFRIAEIPSLALSQPVARVTFPRFAAAHKRGEDFRPALREVMQMILLITALAGVLMSAMAKPLVLFVYGQKWTPMVPVVELLGLWACIRPLQQTLVWALNSVGKPRANVNNSLALTPPLVIAVVLAARSSITAVAGVVLAYACVQTLATSRQISNHVHLPMRDQFRLALPILASAAPVWLAARALATLPVPSGVRIVVGFGVCAALYAGLVRLIAPDVVRIARERGRSLVGREQTVEPPVAA